ncbi:hypothetical protein F383_04563 [Gossypium arboreum]|uniref:Uncharacterized protein n=1 Tax=Gossypium arboreum TaxID=29729 RepID=A0A0B0PDV4_GOSAR|nr:hypothetical protein F383_04563 [Gossypium arboreum]
MPTSRRGLTCSHITMPLDRVLLVHIYRNHISMP